MEKRYLQLIHRTGAAGEISEIDTLILKVMKGDKQISGDIVASSSKPELEIRGIKAIIISVFSYMQTAAVMQIKYYYFFQMPNELVGSTN